MHTNSMKWCRRILTVSATLLRISSCREVLSFLVRKPPSPPLPEDPDQVFEHMLNQLIDQVEVQNHHGEVLKDQVELLYRPMIIGTYYSDTDETAEKIVRDDPLIKELLEQLRNAHEQSERNFIQAQIQVLTFKHIFTTVYKNHEIHPVQRFHAFEDIPEKLRVLSEILNRDKRSRCRSHKVTLGNRLIDRMYDIITAEAQYQNYTERPKNLNISPVWLQNMNILQRDLGRIPRYVEVLVPRPRPDNLQCVSNRASFQLIDQLVNSARNSYYVAPPRNELEHNGAVDMDDFQQKCPELAMNTKSSTKRGGDQSSEIPPKKMVSQVFEASSSANYDVTIIVDGQRFKCLKEELSQHSMYFRSMFNSNFEEKDKKEVELGGMVEPETFEMFLKVVHGEAVVNDDTVEKMLELADYLESATLEASCMRHLRQKTSCSLEKQFQMAETYHSEKLMIQVCASCTDAYELDEVVPKDLDSICNTTKNIVLQRSFELLGIRKPPSPPLPEEPDQVFEHMMNQIIDQVEFQNHHGEVLQDQIELLLEHVLLEGHMPRFGDAAAQTIRDNHFIKELTDELRKAHEPEEVNFIQAQIMVLKFKDIYTAGEHPDNLMVPVPASVCARLRDFAIIINKNKRSHRSYRVTLGDRKIDEAYRSITESVIRYCQNQHIRYVTEHAGWIKRINDLNDYLSDTINERERIQRPMPDDIRHVSNRASFRAINGIVSNMRSYQYSVPRLIQPVVNEEVIEDGPVQDADDQNPEEQDQEGN
ncbi:unnamed protein product [Caenorhabditis brenneri]